MAGSRLLKLNGLNNIWLGQAGLGGAGQGLARHGSAWQDKAFYFSLSEMRGFFIGNKIKIIIKLFKKRG